MVTQLMTGRKLKKGDKVRVYDDPITRERLEDVAQLVKPVEHAGSLEGGYERWMVEFSGDFGGKVIRTVHPNDVVEFSGL